MRFAFPLMLLLFLFHADTPSFAQADNVQVIFHMQSSYTSFPDSSRLKGHVGNHIFYSTADHYSDSHVLIIAPKNLDADKKVDLIFWFHGWHNIVEKIKKPSHLKIITSEPALN